MTAPVQNTQTRLPRCAGAALEIVGAFAALFVASSLIGVLIVPHATADLHTPLLALAMWGAVLAGALFLKWRGSSYRALGLVRPGSWSRTLMWAVAAAVAANLGAIAIGMAIRTFTDWPPLDLSYIRASLHGDVLAYAAWIVLVVWGRAAMRCRSASSSTCRRRPC